MTVPEFFLPISCCSGPESEDLASLSLYEQKPSANLAEPPRAAGLLKLVLPVGLGLILATAQAAGQDRPCDSPSSTLAPSRDLYCLQLVAAPGMHGVSGHVELGRIPGPFTIAVDAEGRSLYGPVMTLAGLPEPSSLGPYSTYVAWVATPLLDPITNVGQVRNGPTTLPPVGLDKFLVLVTAEASAGGGAPSGRIVLRAQSPSTRLQPPDLLEFAIGGMTSPAGQEGPAHSHDHPPSDSTGGAPAGAPAASWAGVPMPAGLRMLPAEMELRPRASAYLPASASVEAVPPARLRELVRLADGDTLRLEARLVRRVVKGRTSRCTASTASIPGPLLQVAAGGGGRGGVHERARSADDGALARHAARQPLRRRARPDAGARSRRAGGSPIDCASRTPGSTGTTRTCARTSSRTSDSTATCWCGRRAGLLRSGQPRGDADARRSPGRRRGARAVRPRGGRRTRSWAASETCCS